MEEKFLSIGSVVKLKNAQKRLMITGFLAVEQGENAEKKIWDYCGCLYPEGILSSKNNFLFNHDQIEEIQFKGFADEEEKSFKEKVNQVVAELNKK